MIGFLVDEIWRLMSDLCMDFEGFKENFKVGKIEKSFGAKI